ncbi:MAG: NADP-dependent oxidoreductase [Candidatus Hydrogenedentes bacterium]|nr:NADP-dependent oxidoreductase [Candidatus Hydrogenedentota bacterium]
MSTPVNRQILLAARPTGTIKASDFKYVESAPPVPGPDQALVRNLYLSLDPAMRGWMREGDSYIEPVKLGDVMRGGTIGEVVASNSPAFAVGDKVFGMGGWQDYYLVHAKSGARVLPADVPFPLTSFLSVLGITGLTAYFGLLDVGKPKAGETVVVSTAAGAVGSIVCQIAKIQGCRVVGIAGSDEKCAWIKNELGVEAAINYKTQDVATELRTACPKKIDVYFDNVGGEILNTVLGMINVHARVVVCGAITQYNATQPTPGPSNYITLLTKRSRMEGFVVIDYMDRAMEGIMQLGQWLAEGRLRYREDIVDGLEHAPTAILRLFNGSNTGKLIVKIA